MHITVERKKKEIGLKKTVLAENGESTDPNRRLFTTRTETPVDGFRSSERNSSGEIGPARRMTDSTILMVKRSTRAADRLRHCR